MILADSFVSPLAAQARKSILIVEDEQDLADLICFNLDREGYVCRHAAGGDVALKCVEEERPDLILLDRMLPGLSGDEVVRRLKKDDQTSTIPVVVLSAKDDESDQLVGFALGADDYVTKPCSIKVLVARVNAILRRVESNPELGDVLAEGPLRLLSDRHQLFASGAQVDVTAMEFRIIKALMTARGRVMSRSQLIDAALGIGVAVTDRTVDVHITALRKKLGDASGWIQTVRGVGYAFREPR